MNTRPIALSAALSLAMLMSTGVVIAQPHADHDHSTTSTPNTASPAATEDLAEGEIRRINASTGRITIRHGYIKSLDMSPMSMVFSVAEPELLNNLKVGDKIRFAAENQQGKLTVTRIVTIP